jgi:UDP-glucuronate decarboxylase
MHFLTNNKFLYYAVKYIIYIYMLTFLVTGGGGFIGVNLISYLINKYNNCKIICVDNFISSNKNNILKIKNNFQNQIYILEINIIDLNFNFLKNNFNFNIDKIFHLACIASPKIYQDNSLQTLDTCYLGTKNILDIAKNYNARIVFSSTSEVYGDPEIKVQNEEYRGNVNTIGIRSCYDEGKRIAETLCFEYQKEFNVNVGIIRIFNTYGPFMNPNDGRVIPNFINQCLKNENITIYGNGEQTRSFCFISDLIDGLNKMININYFGPFNLGNDIDFTINQLALIIKDITNSKSNIIYQDLPQDDPILRKPNIKKAFDNLNWKPSTNLRDGLIKTIKYFESI